MKGTEDAECWFGEEAEWRGWRGNSVASACTQTKTHIEAFTLSELSNRTEARGMYGHRWATHGGGGGTHESPVLIRVVTATIAAPSVLLYNIFIK